MRALLSVSDKEGIVEFAKGLEELGWQILSTGGTYKLLKSEGVKATEVSEFTASPEMFEGRVKTLQRYMVASCINAMTLHTWLRQRSMASRAST